jgi:hypothetical protein
MQLLETVRRAWGFTGLVPGRVLDINPFGNLLVEDAGGRIWRICPEELSCEPVATTQQELQQVRSADDWKMERLVALATDSLGAPGEGRCFCLKIPGVLGGKYEVANLGTIPVLELVAVSGDIASQIKDQPDGAKVRLRIID